MVDQFYDEYYREHSDRAQGWRALGADLKVDHIAYLLDAEERRPKRIVEVGCGDGAVLEELSRRGIGEALVGYEVGQSAVTFVRGRHIARVKRVELFDGLHLPDPDGTYELGLLCHVLEHTERPTAVLRETARVAQCVIVEVPLEDVLASHRPAYRRGAAEIGHIQRFRRQSLYQVVEDAGLRVQRGFFIRQTLADRSFWADTRAAKAKAYFWWALRVGMDHVAPALSHRLLVADYACMCVPQ